MEGAEVTRSGKLKLQWTGQSDQFKMVKATVFKFDTHVPSDSPDMTP